jgi:hypothetical protein
MPIYKVRRFPVCANCGAPTAVAREVAEVPPHVRELAKERQVKECLHCGAAWYETDRVTREQQHQRVYHIVRHTDRGTWLEHAETMTCALPKPRKHRG